VHHRSAEYRPSLRLLLPLLQSWLLLRWSRWSSVLLCLLLLLLFVLALGLSLSSAALLCACQSPTQAACPSAQVQKEKC
jgi:hypothetical protein